jgi:hypothetical protein
VKKFLIFGILAMILPAVMQAHEVVGSDQLQIAVKPHQIMFANGGMFAYIEGEWVALEAIYSDAFGLQAIKKNPHHNRWICSYCGFNNNPWDETCKNMLGDKLCGRPRPW